MKKITLFILISMIILACTNTEQGRVVHAETKTKLSNEQANEEEQDSFSMQVMDLPIQFEGTNILLHPIGEIIEYPYSKRRGNKMFSFGSSSGSSGSGSGSGYMKTSISRHSGNSLNGDMRNIKFEDTKKGTVNTLTDKDIYINRMIFLHDLHEKTGKQLLIYSVYDKDTNGDKVLNRNDLESLYISRIDGTDFQKLNKDNHKLIQWKILTAMEKLYFRTVEDTNQNDKFDKDDTFYNYQVDLNSSDNFTAEKYTFLD